MSSSLLATSRPTSHEASLISHPPSHRRLTALPSAAHPLSLSLARLAAPSVLKLDASMDALSLALIDERGPAGRPLELLHAAMRRLSFQLTPKARASASGTPRPNEDGKYVCEACKRTFDSPNALNGHTRSCDSRATEATFSIGLLQVDNLLPTASHPTVLRTPRRHDATRPGGGGAFGRARRPAGAWAGDPASGGSGAAVRLIVRSRASGQLQDVTVKIQPTDLALEASLIARLGQLLVGTGEPASRVVASLRRVARVGHAALAERLGAALPAPPDWSQRVPFYCDTLQIEAIDLTVSSRMDVDVGAELLLFGGMRSSRPLHLPSTCHTRAPSHACSSHCCHLTIHLVA
jgi:hypothetical protein